MSTHKFRWSKVYESSEEELVTFLQNRNIVDVSRIASSEPGEQMQQTAQLDSTVWCVEGSLVIRIKSASISLQPGDAIRIPAQTAYDLHAGISGFVYYLSS